MNPNAFIGRAKAPSDGDVAAALGAVKPLWDEIVVGMARELDLTASEWKSYGIKHSWALQLRLFILGDRAVVAARAAELGATADELLAEAPRYPEGTGVRLEVTRPRQLPLVRKLARIKLEN